MIGATQSPEVDPERLRDVAPEELLVGFRLEEVCLRALSLAQLDAGSGSIKAAHLADVDLGGSRLRALELVDVVAERIDCANGDWGGARARRSTFADCRLTGLNLAEANLEHVSFRACKLDYANLRHSSLESASFVDCLLNGADFQGAAIRTTRFSGCSLLEADFSSAKLASVDLRGSELAPAGSLLGLAGAIIDPLQLMEIARPLAAELGMIVEER